MLVYIFSAVLALAPVLQAVFDLPLQLAFQRAALAGCLAWLFLGLRSRGFPRGLLEKRFYPLWAAAALSLFSLVFSPFRGHIFNEWGNYAAGLLLFAFGSFLDPAERARVVRALLWGAWLVFGFSLLQAFVLGNFASHPPLTNLNALALYSVMIIPAAIEAGMWPLAGAMIILMVWTQSVGAVLAALAAAGLYAAGRLKGKELKENAWLLAVLAALAVAALYLLQADSIAGRLAWWKSAWDMFSARPVLGFGHASFTWAQAMFQGSGVFREHAIYAHNYYLEFMAENGLLAALAWFWLLFAAARARAGLIKYSVIAALAHSFVDFGLSVPANFWVFCFLLSSPAEAGGAVLSRGATARGLAAALLMGLALLSVDLRSLNYERARNSALAAMAAGAPERAEAELRPALGTKLFRAPALEFLGRLNLASPGGEFRAAVHYEEALLENRYSAEAWLSLRKLYSAPGRERDAAGLELRRQEVYR